jgi:hypothetical protein
LLFETLFVVSSTGSLLNVLLLGSKRFLNVSTDETISFLEFIDYLASLFTDFFHIWPSEGDDVSAASYALQKSDCVPLDPRMEKRLDPFSP